MYNHYRSIFISIVLFVSLIGCFDFGSSYRNGDGQKPPLKEIEAWLGLPLPNNYSDLKYKIIAVAPDANVRISVKVSEDFFQNLIESNKLVNYDRFKATLPYDLKPREIFNTENPDSILAKPYPNTTIWITTKQFYPKYFWYQNSSLYLVYSSD